VRHRGKIESAIHNAKQSLKLIERHGSLASFVWRFDPPAKERPRRVTKAAVVKLTETPTSRALSKALRAEGFSFVGPTTLYAFMQAMGLVNLVAPAGGLEAALGRYVSLFTEKSAAALRIAKRALRAGEERGFDAALRATERLYKEDLMRTEDAREGIRAYLEKREPQWKDR